VSYTYFFLRTTKTVLARNNSTMKQITGPMMIFMFISPAKTCILETIVDK